MAENNDLKLRKELDELFGKYSLESVLKDQILILIKKDREKTEKDWVWVVAQKEKEIQKLTKIKRGKE